MDYLAGILQDPGKEDIIRVSAALDILKAPPYQ